MIISTKSCVKSEKAMAEDIGISPVQIEVSTESASTQEQSVEMQADAWESIESLDDVFNGSPVKNSPKNLSGCKSNLHETNNNNKPSTLHLSSVECSSLTFHKSKYLLILISKLNQTLVKIIKLDKNVKFLKDLSLIDLEDLTPSSILEVKKSTENLCIEIHQLNKIWSTSMMTSVNIVNTIEDESQNCVSYRTRSNANSFAKTMLIQVIYLSVLYCAILPLKLKTESVSNVEEAIEMITQDSLYFINKRSKVKLQYLLINLNRVTINVIRSDTSNKNCDISKIFLYDQPDETKKKIVQNVQQLMLQLENYIYAELTSTKDRRRRIKRISKNLTFYSQRSVDSMSTFAVCAIHEYFLNAREAAINECARNAENTNSSATKDVVHEQTTNVLVPDLQCNAVEIAKNLCAYDAENTNSSPTKDVVPEPSLMINCKEDIKELTEKVVENLESLSEQIEQISITPEFHTSNCKTMIISTLDLTTPSSDYITIPINKMLVLSQYKLDFESEHIVDLAASAENDVISLEEHRNLDKTTCHAIVSSSKFTMSPSYSKMSMLSPAEPVHIDFLSSQTVTTPTAYCQAAEHLITLSDSTHDQYLCTTTRCISDAYSIDETSTMLKISKKSIRKFLFMLNNLLL